MKRLCPSCGELFNGSYGDSECEGCRYVDEPDEDEQQRQQDNFYEEHSPKTSDFI